MRTWQIVKRTRLYYLRWTSDRILELFWCRHSFEYHDRNIFHQTGHLQTPSDFENKNSSDKNLFASEFDLLLLLDDGRNICLMVLFIFQKLKYSSQSNFGCWSVIKVSVVKIPLPAESLPILYRLCNIGYIVSTIFVS